MTQIKNKRAKKNIIDSKLYRSIYKLRDSIILMTAAKGKKLIPTIQQFGRKGRMVGNANLTIFGKKTKLLDI